MKNIILGVTGSIAAYKAADITSKLDGRGYNIQVVMTRGGEAFITPLTFQALSKNRVYGDAFQEEDPSRIVHIDMAREADLFLIAPASADVIGKLANGIADDMLTSMALAVQGVPKLIAPAMNTRMYENPVVQDNLEKLKKYGYEVIEPKESKLACGDIGKGALAGVAVIVDCVEKKVG